MGTYKADTHGQERQEEKVSLLIIQMDTLILPDPPQPATLEFRNTKWPNNNFTSNSRERRRLTKREAGQAGLLGHPKLTSGGGGCEAARGGVAANPSSNPNLEHSGQRVWQKYPVPERKLSLRMPRVLQPKGNGVLPTPETAHAGPAAGPNLKGGSSPAAPRPGGGRWASGRRGRVFTNKGAGARGGGARGAGPGPRDTHPARCRPSRPGQPPPAPAPGLAALRPPPPPPRDPARAAAAATGTRPHNASLFSPPPAHTAPRHAAAGGRADEWPKT